MKLYTDMISVADAATSVVLDEMILTADMPTTAGSQMLCGYRSLFGAEVIDRLAAAGIAVSGKVDVGEFGIDLLGETCFRGATEKNGELIAPAALALLEGEAMAAVVLDVNGAPRRAAALAGLTYVKPTYGTVSRYGTIPAACSGDTIGVMAKSAADCRRVLSAIAGHDDKDGTSLSDVKIALTREVKEIRRVLVISDLLLENPCDDLAPDMRARIDSVKAALCERGIEVVEDKNATLSIAHEAWNVLMTAELCNNVSRYDGVKFGYRTENFTNLDELYTNSRTEAFGGLLKLSILYGSDTLSTENYMSVYDKALRIRRKAVEAFAEIFADYDAVLLPAASRTAYTPAELSAEPTLPFRENRYTAPASITGLPSVVTRGVAFVGPAFSEGSLLDLAALLEKEGN